MTSYIRYIIENIEPLRIADDSMSQSGQTSTLRHIPGSSVRGLVINKLAEKMSEDDFEKIKSNFLSDNVRFLNAYLYADKELLPSPKGFYETKESVAKGSPKTIQNVVVKGEFDEGLKRANLGRYSSIVNGTIEYYNIDTNSDLKIKINLEKNEKQNVFRNEYIIPGYKFCGYIAIEDTSKELIDLIKAEISGDIVIGNARSSGLGKCKIIECELMDDGYVPYSDYLSSKPVTNECYMLLLSHMTMRDAVGQYCGINTERLQDLLGVNALYIDNCSTTKVEVKGFNRKLNIKLPSVAMYEQGSVFKLAFSGEISAEKMKEVMNAGIGVRTNEGFGRVVFLKDYHLVDKKIEKDYNASTICYIGEMPEDKKVIEQLAKRYLINKIDKALQKLIVEKKLDSAKASKSQIGIVNSIIVANKYNPKKAMDILEKYFGHAKEKEEKNKQQKVSSFAGDFGKGISDILNKSIQELYGIQENQIFGCDVDSLLSDDEKAGYKFDYIISMLKMSNRKGV